MMKKVVFLSLFFYFLVLIQTSFLVHFKISGIVPNLILIVVVFINLFEKTEKKTGLISGFLGGFFLDTFSITSQGLNFNLLNFQFAASFSGFFGFHILVLLILAAFIKFILKKHVRIPTFKKL